MKRTSIVLSVLVGIVALFAYTEVMATDPCQPVGSAIPTCCTLVDSNGNPNSYGWKLSVLPDPTTGEWPMKMADGRYKWTYQLTGPLMQSMQVTTLAPVCYPEASQVHCSIGGQIIPSGVNFGLASSSKSFYFYTVEKAPIVRRSMQLNVRIGSTNQTFFCRNIEGPDCLALGLPPDLTPLNTVEEKNLGEFIIRITRDGVTWCAAKVELWNGVSWEEIFPEPEPTTIDGQDLISCLTPDGNQKCQECIIYGASSPGCYTYSSGGRTYKVPAGCK